MLLLEGEDEEGGEEGGKEGEDAAAAPSTATPEPRTQASQRYGPIADLC